MAGVLSDLHAASGVEAADGAVPVSELAVVSLDNDSTADELQLVDAPHGLIELGPAEIKLLAIGPAPSDLRIRLADNRNAADTTNADQLQVGGSLGLDLTGKGYTVGVWDGGLIRSTHQEFDNRVTLVDSSSSADHATHVAGTIGAAGINAAAKGMAPQVGLRSREWTNDFSEMDADAALIDVSNHSYGLIAGWVIYPASTFGFSTPTGYVDVWWEDRFLYSAEAISFGKYDSNSRELDQVLFDNADLLSVWSAGNDRTDAFQNAAGNGTYVTWFSGDPGGIGWSRPGWYLVPNSGATSAPGGDGNAGTGYDSLSLTKNAKNALIVGAVYDVTSDPYTSAQIVTTGFSSYGPTDDGRVKPDVVGNGNSLFSPVAVSDTAYGYASGTSMSSPNVAGTSVLVIEHFDNEFGVEPLSASTKGLLIHTASDAGNPGPDYAYGWGLVNAAAAATFISDAATADTTSYLEERSYGGSAWSLDLVSNGTQPLKATIVWTDPAPTVLPGSGLDDPTPVLVNDLDLWITGPGGATYYPWTLDPLNPSAAAVRTKANHVDNVEQVAIDAPAAGVYKLHVGRTGSLFSQPYTLLVSGAFAPAPTPEVSLSLAGSPMTEAGGEASVTATLSEKSRLPVIVNLAFSGTATLAADYTPSGTSITIPKDATSGQITLTAVQDVLNESGETIVVDVDSVSDGTEDGTQQVTATITDDDPPPTVTLGLAGSPMAEAGGTATVTATLSAVSGLPVTVCFAFSGAATPMADYTSSSDCITIPAGSISGSITLTAVQDTVDKGDETIVVDIDTVENGTENGTQTVTAVITNDDLIRFFVVDNKVDDMFGYDADGNNLSRSDLVAGATDARGIATTPDASQFWILHAKKTVYVADADRKALGSWKAAQLRTPTGITTDGTDIWIVDKGTDTVYRFNNAAGATTGALIASSSFKLAKTNAMPEGIATDGTTIWVVNSGKPDRVYVYDMAGAYRGYWNIDPTNVSPTGITIDPTGASQSIWIVDVSKDRVYEYAGGRAWTSGSKKADSFFALAPGNKSPQDIVDPDGSLRRMAAYPSAAAEETPAGDSAWSPSAVASSAWLAVSVPQRLRADMARSVLQTTIAVDRSRAGEGAQKGMGPERAGPAAVADKTVWAGDQVKEDLITMLSGRTGARWPAAADLLLSDLGWLQTLAAGKSRS